MLISEVKLVKIRVENLTFPEVYNELFNKPSSDFEELEVIKSFNSFISCIMENDEHTAVDITYIFKDKSNEYMDFMARYAKFIFVF